MYKSVWVYLAIQSFPSTTNNSCTICGIILHWILMILTLNFFSLLFLLPTLLYTYKNHTYYCILMLYVINISNHHIPINCLPLTFLILISDLISDNTEKKNILKTPYFEIISKLLKNCNYRTKNSQIPLVSIY